MKGEEWEAIIGGSWLIDCKALAEESFRGRVQQVRTPEENLVFKSNDVGFRYAANATGNEKNL